MSQLTTLLRRSWVLRAFFRRAALAARLTPWLALADLSPARSAIEPVLARAESDLERRYLLLAAAAGRTAEEITAFADRIRGRSDHWLDGHLRLVDPAVPGAVPIAQSTPTTCGSVSILMTRALLDPVYALSLTDTDLPFADRLAQEERRIHDATNRLWPQRLGTSPWGVSGALGRAYDWRLVDDTNPASIGAALRDAVAAVEAGHPVPVLIGDGYPRHYVLLIGPELTFFNPSGEVVRVPPEAFLAGDLGILGFRHVQGIVLPARVDGIH
ncbi:hypothetical protein AB0M43_15325 [Longispora sp. NPDC051575]|uniref:hypothetical protein n=1 Tax=Longispora sp. NPDC051575 TaxID=3154943 RepID=UPI00342740E1